MTSNTYWTSDYKSLVMSDTGKEMFISLNEKHLAAFKKLIQRGANLWPDAPPYIKDLADIITNDGVIQQNYYAQDTSPKDTEKKTAESTDNDVPLLGKGVSYE